LPLSLGKELELPEIYKHIQGKRQPYVWRKGRIKNS
jgi:hypothetical protein